MSPSAVATTGEDDKAVSCVLAALGSSPRLGTSDEALDYGALFNKVSLNGLRNSSSCLRPLTTCDYRPMPLSPSVGIAVSISMLT